MRGRLLVLALASLTASTAHAQSNWVASIRGGYSVSTSTAESFPAGGSFGSSGFIGRQLSPLFSIGLEAGFFEVENTTTLTRETCPLSSGLCDVSTVVQVNWIQLGMTGRAGVNSGHWRPYGAVGLAFYFGTRDADATVTNTVSGDGPFPLPTAHVNRTAVGGSIGGGLDWVPNERAWSLGVSAGLHYLIGGDENGEFGGDTFVTLLAGVGYRW